MKLSKNVLYILESPIIFFQVSQKSKSNLLSHRTFVQGVMKPNFVGKYNTIFLGKGGWPWNFPKISSHIKVLYKLVFGSVKSLNRIFSVIEYQCSKMKNLDKKHKTLVKQDKTFPKVSLHIRVSFKFLLKVTQKLKLNILSDWIFSQD